MKASRSEALFDRAREVLPGGVSSPVRAFGSVGGNPLFIASGSGSTILDVDGNEYIDLVMSWGPLIHGHANPDILQAVDSSSRSGTTFGAPTEVEVELAELVCVLMPGIEMVRFVSSGTEATMSAVRLARAYTGRDVLVKFDGGYHGHVDSLLIEAGSGALTHGIPTSAGISSESTQTTRGLPYNDVGALELLFGREGDQIAAVIVEPVAGNMGTIPPHEHFLGTLRWLCDKHQVLLIFDEVITGFRVALGGAQTLFGIRPDLTCLGKILGGGFSAAAFGGRREVMEMLSPLGPVYQAGTLSGNPVAMAAGLEALKLCRNGDYGRLTMLAGRLAAGLRDLAGAAGHDICINRCESMLSLFFTKGPVHDLTSAQESNVERYARFFHLMLEQGVYLPPSQFETWMLSFAHTEDDVARVLSAAGQAFQRLTDH